MWRWSHEDEKFKSGLGEIPSSGPALTTGDHAWLKYKQTYKQKRKTKSNIDYLCTILFKIYLLLAKRMCFFPPVFLGYR